MKHIIFCFMAFCLAFSACKKPVDPNPTPTPGQPTVTPKGTDVGIIATKNIGTQGSTNTSIGNALTINIPAGALGSVTNISIQPITNNCPNGNGIAYRLQPEGLAFNSPVTITFAYPQDHQADQIHIA